MKRAWPWVVVLAVCVAVGAGVPAWTQARVAARYPVTADDLAAGRADLRPAPGPRARAEHGVLARAVRPGLGGRRPATGATPATTCSPATSSRSATEDDHCTVLARDAGGAVHGHDARRSSAGRTRPTVQIDHVVPLADAWETGAQQWPASKRLAFANDPANLLAVDGPANQDKGAGDAATWLPPNKGYRCVYALRQIRVKAAYGLWVTAAEHDALERELGRCVVAQHGESPHPALTERPSQAPEGTATF